MCVLNMFINLCQEEIAVVPCFSLSSLITAVIEEVVVSGSACGEAWMFLLPGINTLLYLRDILE